MAVSHPFVGTAGLTVSRLLTLRADLSDGLHKDVEEEPLLGLSEARVGRTDG